MVDTGEQTSHDMTGIAIIKENTTPMLKMEQALKGKIGPNEKDNEELTALFKNGMEGTKQEATENIAKWARRIKIEKEIKWIGKEEKRKKETNKKSIEDKIAEWILDPEARYPWEKKEDEEEMETHEQYLSMAGVMYGSIKENWSKTGRKEKVIKEMQQKITEILFRKTPEFLEYRQKCIRTKEIQDGYKRNKTQYKMTKDGKTQLLYTGEEMTVIDGRMVPEKTRQQEMSKDKGKIPR